MRGNTHIAIAVDNNSEHHIAKGTQTKRKQRPANSWINPVHALGNRDTKHNDAARHNHTRDVQQLQAHLRFEDTVISLRKPADGLVVEWSAVDAAEQIAYERADAHVANLGWIEVVRW